MVDNGTSMVYPMVSTVLNGVLNGIIILPFVTNGNCTEVNGRPMVFVMLV